jgi:hypothetical protein
VTTGPDWGEQLHRLVDGVRGLLSDASQATEGMGHGSDCRWCPLCQAAAVVRGERPEVNAALADLLGSTASALRAFAETHATGPAGADAAADDVPSAPPPPEVQRIEIA